MKQIFKPKPGHILRYDFLWDDEQKIGREYGKDRPCAVVVAIPSQADPEAPPELLLCPITHSPPLSDTEKAIELPQSLCRKLGLDDRSQWIKTHELNRVPWGTPGFTKAKSDDWAYGQLPKSMWEKMRDAVLHHREKSELFIIRRNSD